MKRNFKGIWIPKDLWINEAFNCTEKCLLVEIDSLDCSLDHCYATNAYFSDFLGVSTATVTRMIKKFEGLGLITIKNRTCQKGVERIIKMTRGYSQNDENPLSKMTEPPKQNDEGNKRVINTERKIDINGSDDFSASNFIEETKDYWNSKDNLPGCRLSVFSFGQDTGLMATRIRDFGLDYVTGAIDKLSQAWGGIEYKYRPKSYQRFILGNVEYWANYEVEETNLSEAEREEFNDIFRVD